jgi:hypothetical protein
LGWLLRDDGSWRGTAGVRRSPRPPKRRRHNSCESGLGDFNRHSVSANNETATKENAPTAPVRDVLKNQIFSWTYAGAPYENRTRVSALRELFLIIGAY